MDKFVCVRLVQVWGVDLSVFQFENGQTWAVFLMNADRTIYGRYGTRSAHDTMKDISLEGFKRAMEGALELHKGYPANKKSLAAKTGPAPKWKTPESIPTLSGKHKQGDLSGMGCIHCHMVYQNEILSRWASGETIADQLLWSYPMPDVLGFSLDKKERANVSAVVGGSPAELAGLRTGDKILQLDGQPILSIADVQWALVAAPESGQLKGQLDRVGKKVDFSLRLTQGWRRKGEFTSMSSSLQMTVAGFEYTLLSSSDRKAAGLADGVLAIRVGYLPDDPREGNQTARKAGLRDGDIIVALDGKTTNMNLSEFLAYLLQKKKPGQSATLSVLRGGRPQTINLSLQ